MNKPRTHTSMMSARVSELMSQQLITTMTEEMMDRCINNILLCCQPMKDDLYSYRGVLFETKYGYYVYKNSKYAMLEDVRSAIWWDEFLNKKN
jgi:hypothetical protein